MRVLCNRCKNIFNAEEHSACPYCGQTGKIPTEADYSRSKPMERDLKRRAESERSESTEKTNRMPKRNKNVRSEGNRISEKKEKRSAYSEKSAKPQKTKPQKPIVEIEYVDDDEYETQNGCLVGIVKTLCFIAASFVVFFVGVGGGYAFSISYTSGNKNVADNIRPIDDFYSGVEQGYEGFPIIATTFLPYLTENGADTMKITYFDNFNTVYAGLRSISGNRYSINYDVSSETKLSGDRIEEIQKEISEKVSTNVSVSSGYNVVTKAVVSADDDLSKIRVEFTTICFNGTWYIYDLKLAEV